MAYGSNPGNPGPAGDYFGDDAGAAPKMEEKEEHAQGDTGILPKTLMAGKDFKVGEEIVLKIAAIHENDFEVEYAHDESEHEGGGGEPSMETSGTSGGGMEEMMS